MAFNVIKLIHLKLNWKPIPTKYRLFWYKVDSYLERYLKIKISRITDFEMGQSALNKIKKHSKYKAFNLCNPWNEKAQLKFDTSTLPKNKAMIDPLHHYYPEEWWFEGTPFATHQRCSTGMSFNRSMYSTNWLNEIEKYLYSKYLIKIDR